MYKCKYCNKEFSSAQSLAGHIGHCKMNPNYDKNKLNCNNDKKISIVKYKDTSYFGFESRFFRLLEKW